jgi:hypothetical protein
VRVVRDFFFLVVLCVAATASASAHGAKTYASPDKALRATVTSAGPEGRDAAESVVEIRGPRNELLLKKSFASEDGEHGYAVVKAAWTPDSRFFVFSVESSGGHQPWHAPTFVYRRGDGRLLALDDVVGPISSPAFTLKAPHTISTEQWVVAEQAGRRVTLNLRELSPADSRRKEAPGSGSSR